VATHLSRHLHAQGHSIDCVWSRSLDSALTLAHQVEARASSLLSELPRQADFYLLAVPDEAVAGLAADCTDYRGIWLHCAGALPMQVFQGLFPEYGVMYPLQTLNKEFPLQSGKIPFLVEGSSPEVTAQVTRLASSIAERVEALDSASRLVVHLAAVFANNFSNHMVHIAQEILKEQNLPAGILDPLLEETYRKVLRVGAGAAQTGPAVRDDQITLKRHIEWLKSHPEWEKLYTFVSREIARSRKE